MARSRRPTEIGAGCRPPSTWEGQTGVVIGVKGKAHLFEVVLALRLPRASRADSTAGSSRASITAMMAITTKSSTSVKPSCRARRIRMRTSAVSANARKEALPRGAIPAAKTTERSSNRLKARQKKRSLIECGRCSSVPKGGACAPLDYDLSPRPSRVTLTLHW